MRYIFIFLLPVLIWAGCSAAKPYRYVLESPEKKTRVHFDLTGDGRPYYQVYYQQKLVIDTSYLGFELNNATSLKEKFEIIDTKESTFDETWEQPWGEEQFIRNHYNQISVSLQEKHDLKRKLTIVFRAFEDGVGFRYEFPDQENLHNIEITEELTQFNLAADYSGWSIPAFEPNRYEYLYRHLPASQMGKMHTPVTFETKDKQYISIHEAALKDYSSMTLDANGGKNLHCFLVPYSKTEKSKSFIKAPGETPWRTIQLADKPGDLITSYLILNLNEPNALGDVSWFRPGKYIGIWWEMHIDKGTWSSGPKHSANTENTKRYIDFASKNGFDGVLVEGWNIGWDGDWTKNGSDFSFTQHYPDYDLPALAAYAKSKGVYLVGHHETAGNIDNYESQMNDAFSLLEKNGMKAVKTGYVEHGNILTNGKYHHGQAYVDHFRKVIQLGAKHKVAIVAHEPIHDTGERRTYPNMISREGARGQEFNAWSDDGGNPPNHEIILAFTRCLSGPMDFTPGVFDITIPAKPKNQVNTTLAKQLALYVTMYAPMQMACDLPEHYEKYPDAFQFIKEVGVDWKTTKVIDSEIGKFLITAREEKGSGNWFVGAITNEEARTVTIPLSFLQPGETYSARIYSDGDTADYQTNPESYKVETKQVTSKDTITTKLARSGGLAVSLIKTKS